MNLDKINRWLTLLANLGVLAGILFLAIELEQNTKATQAQTRDSITEKLNSWQLTISANEFTALAFYKGLRNEELTPAETAAFNMLMTSNLRMWENEWYQYELGLFTAEEFEPRLVRWERSMADCGYQRNWGTGRAYSPGFREVINELIKKAPPVDCNR